MTSLNTKRLRKLRRPGRNAKNPKYSAAYVEEFNARQHMRCVETRRRWNQTDNSTGAPGGRATTVAMVEAAQRTLPKIELAAHMAMVHGTQREQNQLVDEMEKIIVRDAKKENWKFNGDDSPLRLLASIIVDEWLNPASFWREKVINDVVEERMVVGAFTSILKCDRKTWHVRWKQYFYRYRGYPEQWYQRGDALMKVRG